MENKHICLRRKKYDKYGIYFIRNDYVPVCWH